ncbi:MAG TPA: D-alanine--D-alanine ligase family protein [Candidatus Pristimantibacillus sp.]|jgi:D-alanine-D-alanine ligase|nr:D-alanine--D-alanine ligase family protein [Candidatus Pristimantibacillus sp.]
MKTIAVIFGGKSAEHDVSIVTAIGNVIKPLELSKKYRIEAVYITKNGAWFWDDKLKDIKLFTSGEIDKFVARANPASVQFDGGMTLVKSSGLAGRKRQLKIDIVFPSMHGTYGEDGTLMGVLDMAGVPYVGCGLEASVLAMDKVVTKQMAVANNLPSNKFVYFMSKELERNPAAALKRVKAELKYPMFVKPAHLGSSIAITKVANDIELRNAMEVAARFDDKIIVEEAVANLIEVTLPILGNDELTPAYLEQPMISAESFFDFETKYMSQGGKKTGGAKSGGAKRGAQGYSKIPADLPKDLYAKAEAIGLGVYRALGCSGTARVDMLIDGKAKQIYVNEVNPLPGSLYAHNWRQKGVSNVELVTRLVELAEERWHERQNLSTVFSTNFLKQF